MQPDNEALENQKALLRQYVLSLLQEDITQRGEIAEAVLDGFVRLTPPDEEPPSVELITLRSAGRRGGRSRKPGNIFLNWRNLIELIPDVTLAAATGLAGPQWLVLISALYIWNHLWSKSAVELDQAHAVTILALWRNRNGFNKVSEEEGFVCTNEVLTSMGLPPLQRADYTEIIETLANLQCVEVEDGVIWLREWVKTTY